jgi:hypothetical protein
MPTNCLSCGPSLRGKPRTHHHFLIGPGILAGAFFLGLDSAKNKAPPRGATAGLNTGIVGKGVAGMSKELAHVPS